MTLSEKLFSFSGRLNRQPWWILGLSLWVVVVLCQVLLIMVFGGGVTPTEGGAPPEMASFGGAGIVVMLLGLVALWINLALTVKRFHDRDKSGWWVLIALVPVVGGLWILIECGCLPGTSGDNRFGGDPLTA